MISESLAMVLGGGRIKTYSADPDKESIALLRAAIVREWAKRPDLEWRGAHGWGVLVERIGNPGNRIVAQFEVSDPSWPFDLSPEPPENHRCDKSLSWACCCRH